MSLIVFTESLIKGGSEKVLDELLANCNFSTRIYLVTNSKYPNTNFRRYQHRVLKTPFDFSPLVKDRYYIIHIIKKLICYVSTLYLVFSLLFLLNLYL